MIRLTCSQIDGFCANFVIGACDVTAVSEIIAVLKKWSVSLMVKGRCILTDSLELFKFLLVTLFRWMVV